MPGRTGRGRAITACAQPCAIAGAQRGADEQRVGQLALHKAQGGKAVLRLEHAAKAEAFEHGAQPGAFLREGSATTAVLARAAMGQPSRPLS